MAETTPFAQLVGALTIYLAVYGTAEPDVTTTPGSSWVQLGCTEGDQTFESTGPLTVFYDNCHQGPVKAVRPQEDVTLGFRLVDLTLENLARIVRSVGAVATPTANTKKLTIKKGFAPTEYALLFRGTAESPYGNYPGQHYVPRGVFEGEFTRTRSTTARDAVDVLFRALEDDLQSDMDRLGWTTVQIS